MKEKHNGTNFKVYRLGNRNRKIGRVYGWGKTEPGAILGSPRDLDKGRREAPNGGINLEGDLKGKLDGNLVLLRHAKECMTPFNSIGPTFFHKATLVYRQQIPKAYFCLSCGGGFPSRLTLEKRLLCEPTCGSSVHA